MALLLLDKPHISPLLVVCSKNVSILHRFQEFSIFAMYVTASDLQKSFSVKQAAKLQATCAFQFMCEHIIVN